MPSATNATTLVHPGAVKIVGETKPCRLMDDNHQGLKDALVEDWRGGVFGEVVMPGEINVGDSIEKKDENGNETIS